MKTQRFKDRIIFHAQAGQGGDGSASLRRERFLPKGGPDGGDGGRGGDVFIEARPNCRSLEALFFQPLQKAENGGPGRGGGSHGRNGRDCLLPVPPGTVALDADSGELLGEVTEEGQRLLLAEGGRGGLGNVHFATSTHQTPREYTPGEAGGSRRVRLEWKTVSDAGLVGFPNAGKSSLLSKLTRARPIIAPYAFTTTHPVMGTLLFDDYRRLTVAEIPGLTKGAHEGAGLGHSFLRHVERARLLVLVIDMGAPEAGEPTEVYRTLREELRLHREELDHRPRLVAASKMDLPAADERLAAFRACVRDEIFPISTRTGEGVDALTQRLYRAFFEPGLP